MNHMFAVRRIAIGLVAVVGLLGSAFGASDYLLTMEGIPGESRVQEGAIDVLAYSHDVKSPRDSASGLATGRRGHGGGGGAGKVNLSDISFSKTTDKSTAKLMEACAKGKHIASAQLQCRTKGDKPTTYLTITMSDCIISSYSTGTTNEDERPAESISINFQKITFLYTPGGGSPPIEFHWVKNSYDRN